MKSFLAGLLEAAISASIQTAATATQSGAGFKNTGLSAALGALLGTTSYILQHPATAHPQLSAAAQTALTLPVNVAPAAVQAVQ